MVAMGRALMMEPSVLLLDEPSAGLSPVMQDEVFVQTRRINRAGVSVVMVEQNASRCLQISDRGYVLDQGRNAYTGTGQDLAKDPKVIELYLGTLAKKSCSTPGRPRPPVEGVRCPEPGVQPGATTASRRPSAVPTSGPPARGRGSCAVVLSRVRSLDEAGDRGRPARTCCPCVLVDADRAGRRATGVVHVGRTAGTFVVDVLAVLEQLRALLERRALGALRVTLMISAPMASPLSSPAAMAASAMIIAAS